MFLNRSVRKAIEKVETVMKTGLGESSPESVAVYKELLVEAQLEQLKLFREFQRKAVDNSENAGNSQSNQQPNSSSSKDVGGIEAEWEEEWERRMKQNISEKIEAIAQARESKEMLKALQRQMDKLKEIIRSQDDKLAHTENIQRYLEENCNADELAFHYAKLSQEVEEKRQHLSDVQRQNIALQEQLERKKRHLELLMSSSPSHPAAATTSPQSATASSPQPSTQIPTAPQCTQEASTVKELQEEFALVKEELESKIALLEDSLQEERTRCVGLKRELSQLEVRSKTPPSSPSSTANNDSQLLLKQSESSRRLLETQLRELEEDKALREQREADLAAQLETAQLEAKQLMQQLEDIQSTNSAALGRSEERDQKIHSLTAENSKLSSQLNAATADTASTKAALSEASGQVQALSAEVSALKQELEDVQATLLTETASKDQAHQRVTELEAILSDLQLSNQQALDDKRQVEEAYEQSKVEWDCTNARLEKEQQLLNTKLQQVQSELDKALEESAAALKQQKHIFEERLAEGERSSAEKLAGVLEEKRLEIERLRADADQELMKTKESYETQLTSLQAQHATSIAAVEAERDDAFVAMAEFKKEAEEEKARALEELRSEMESRVQEAIEMTRNRMQGMVDEYKQLYVKENSLRRKVHNELMDLKGNIRVFCRVRPILPAELANGSEDSADITEFPVDNEIVLNKDEASANRFEFDSVFSPSTTQQEVFEDICPLVTSVLDGYNVCIFAYGQTGSGKTYTMEGPSSDPGVNLRALSALFSIRDERVSDEEYTFTVSILEIYNETVRDLLTKLDKQKAKTANLDIRLNQDGKVYVQGLEEVAVQSMSDVRSAIKTAQGNRAVGAHNMNEHSSRSHLVLTVNVQVYNKISGSRRNGLLNLIDLAGSERVSKTDASGDRLREAQNINKSLSALGDVIAALGQAGKSKQGHVPFRNSKLTYLLQNSLGGDSKVAMFVNISPVKWNATESVCSLNFAQRCRKVQLGQAKKNGTSSELAKYRKMVDDLKSQLAAQSRTYDVASSSSSNSTPKKPGRR